MSSFLKFYLMCFALCLVHDIPQQQINKFDSCVISSTASLNVLNRLVINHLLIND